MFLFAAEASSFFGAAWQAAGETVSAWPTTSTITAVIAAVVGALKMFGIGPTQYKEYVGRLIAFIAVKWRGDSLTEKVTLNSLEKILDLLIDKLIAEQVPVEEIEKIANGIAPLVQGARLKRFQASVKEKCAAMRGAAALPELAAETAL